MAQVPYQVLELTIISAQNLAPVSKKLRTYAIAWVNPDRKLRTRVDQQGNLNPNWNDKFVFRVDDDFLNSGSSALMIEIYALGWLRDFPVGNVRVLITDLIPPAIQRETNNKRFVALQIRRPSGRPQGILNMCVTLLDNTMRSMPLFSEYNSSTHEFLKDLKDENNRNDNSKPSLRFHEEKKVKAKDNIKLWRSRSDRTDLNSHAFQKTYNKCSSMINGSMVNGGSMLNGSMLTGCNNGPFINGGSMVNGGSMLNGSECGASDVGPSPSVVAAAVAMGLYPTQIPVPRKTGGSILEDWTVEEKNAEGLKSKIDRWKMEAPIYDHRDYQRMRKNNKHKGHRHSDGGGGLLSCFGTTCEFKIVCGERKSTGKRYGSASEVNLLASEVNSS